MVWKLPSLPSVGLRRFLANKVVDQHGDEQHRAKEHLEPVGVDPGEEDALAHHPEDEGPEHRADDRPVAAREEHASDNSGDNSLKFPELTPEYVGGAGVEDRDRSEQRRGGGGRHEEQDLYPVHRHADVARGDRVAAGPEDPVSKSRAHQDPGRQSGQSYPPEDRDGDVGDLPGEDRHQEAPLGLALETRNLRAAGDQARKAYGGPAQDEQRRQSNDERRQPGANHHVTVRKSDQQRHPESEEQRGPQRPTILGDRDGYKDSGGPDHRADREVELPGDHQERYGDGDDAELRRHLQVADRARLGKEPLIPRHDGEEREDEYSSGDGAQFGTIQQLAQEADLANPLVGGMAGGGCHSVLLSSKTWSRGPIHGTTPTLSGCP